MAVVEAAEAVRSEGLHFPVEVASRAAVAQRAVGARAGAGAAAGAEAEARAGVGAARRRRRRGGGDWVLFFFGDRVLAHSSDCRWVAAVGWGG